MNQTEISVVVPVYMGLIFLTELHDRLRQTMEQLNVTYEIILVNDDSPDSCWPDIVKLCEEDSHVCGINLSRNFGQHYAITAGLTQAHGEWVVVMDCDLQDVPEEIITLYRKAQEGYDTVLAQRTIRRDVWSKRLGSKLFYMLFSYLTETKMDASIANFGIYRNKVIRAILSMGDSIRYFPAMVQWVGFRRIACPVQHSARREGKSSYNFRRLFKLAWNNMVAFSDKLLRIVTIGGVTVSVMSFLIAAFYFTLFLSGYIRVSGFASLILSLWFIGGILMATIGVVGIYVGKTFAQAKNRPSFIVSDTIRKDGV